MPLKIINLHNIKKEVVGSVLVDDEDYDSLNCHKWCLTTTGYARRNTYGKIIRMHREIMGITDSKIFVDHINGNKLDNRKENLRKCSSLQNGWNSSSKNIIKTSIYKGVHWSKDRGKWVASIGYKNSVIALGRFSSEKEAALAYNYKAKELFNEYARLNEVA